MLYFIFIILKVQEIQEDRVSTDEKSQDSKQKEIETNHLERELEEENIRVSSYLMLFQDPSTMHELISSYHNKF